MKVGIGIILSVLSSSVLSAVIPNDGDHGPLLVRRAGSLANKDASWSKDNEDQTGPDPSSSGSGTESESGTGIGENTSSASSSSRGLSKMGQLREFAEELRMRFMKNRDPRKQQYILRNNEKSFQTAIKKLAEATEGVSKDQFVVEVKKFLRTALDGASAFEAVNAIKEEVTKGRVTFKGKTQSRFGAFKTGVKKRLGLKGKSSTDVTSNREEPEATRETRV
ncbi:hypothetical protein BASA62_009260 [Batrachochytrium salamandrivorans]|nr:hypothetical protein BASA62_009260 [Batrachochytrium salamandrivorans]